MNTFQQLIINTKSRLGSWVADNLPKLGVVTGIGVSAWCIGATLGQLTAEAQVMGWGTAIAILSAELGKEFVVGLVERIHDENLNEEDIARIVQIELDKGTDLPDIRQILEEVGTLPVTLEQILRLNNSQLLESLQADLVAYPQLISIQTADIINGTLSPQIQKLSQDISSLDAKNLRILAILESLIATPHIALQPGVEPPLRVFVSSLINELSAERQVLRHTLTSLGITNPWIFEFTPATTKLLENTYLDKIISCDFFILLIDENVSPAVEKEYETAVKHNRPILAFLKKDRDDKDERRSLAAKSMIHRIHTKWDTFRDTVDLALKARVSITDEIIRRVRNGFLPLSDSQVHRLEQVESSFSRMLNNLPPRRYTHLLGREEEIRAIMQSLQIPDFAAPSVIAITGLGGIGKTAIAYEIVSRAIIEGLFDGLVWESAKSEELEGSRIVPLTPSSTLSIETLVRTIANQLGYDQLLQLPPNELLIRVRQILQDGSYLIVVDNLETIEAYEELARNLHGLLSLSRSDRPSKALLTSRERLTEISYVDDHYLRGLPKLASFQFLEQEAHDRKATGILQAGEKLLERIYKITYGMPLAMKLLVSQFIAGIALDTELDRLEGAREEDLYEFIYMKLWFKLSIPSQKVLVAAAAFASSVARFMLQPVSKTKDEEFEVAIPELVRMSLIEPSDHPIAKKRRYSIHPITRWFINAPLRTLWEQQKGNP